jgi:hypothetical protein
VTAIGQHVNVRPQGSNPDSSQSKTWSVLKRQKPPVITEPFVDKSLHLELTSFKVKICVYMLSIYRCRKRMCPCDVKNVQVER